MFFSHRRGHRFEFCIAHLWWQRHETQGFVCLCYQLLPAFWLGYRIPQNDKIHLRYGKAPCPNSENGYSRTENTTVARNVEKDTTRFVKTWHKRCFAVLVFTFSTGLVPMLFWPLSSYARFYCPVCGLTGFAVLLALWCSFVWRTVFSANSKRPGPTRSM